MSFYIPLDPCASFCILVFIYHLKPLGTKPPFVQTSHLEEHIISRVSAFQHLLKLGGNDSRPPKS